VESRSQVDLPDTVPDRQLGARDDPAGWSCPAVRVRVVVLRCLRRIVEKLSQLRDPGQLTAVDVAHGRGPGVRAAGIDGVGGDRAPLHGPGDAPVPLHLVVVEDLGGPRLPQEPQQLAQDGLPLGHHVLVAAQGEPVTQRHPRREHLLVGVGPIGDRLGEAIVESPVQGGRDRTWVADDAHEAGVGEDLRHPGHVGGVKGRLLSPTRFALLGRVAAKHAVEEVTQSLVHLGFAPSESLVPPLAELPVRDPMGGLGGPHEARLRRDGDAGVAVEHWAEHRGPRPHGTDDEERGRGVRRHRRPPASARLARRAAPNARPVRTAR